MFTGRHPADAEARRQTFGKRGAVEEIVIFIQAFRRLRRIAAKPELTVDIILYQRDFMPRQDLHQPPLVFRRHGAAERVLEVRHQPAGFDIIAPCHLFQRIKVNPGLRIGFDRHRFQAQTFNCLQCAVKCRGFNHHPIPRFRDRL